MAIDLKRRLLAMQVLLPVVQLFLYVFRVQTWRSTHGFWVGFIFEGKKSVSGACVVLHIRYAAVWYDMVWFRMMWCGHCQWRVVLCSLVMFRALAILWPRGSSLDVLRVRESVHMKDYEEWHTIYVSQSCHVMVVWLGVRVRLGALVFCGLYVRVRVCVCA